MTTVGLNATPAHAQAPATDAASVPFPDVPANHWAYQAVADLAAKGYVKGYPDGTYGGHRAMTRYEFATVIERMLQTVNDLAAKVAAAPAPQVIQTPSGGFASVDDLNKLQALVDTFKAQLVAIGTPIAPVQDQIDALRQDIADVKDKLAKIKAEADNSYGAGSDRKFQISGYVQARFEQIESGNETAYPNGTSASVGPSASYNGNYGVGGNNSAIFIRRTRLKVAGAVTQNARYAIQIDASNSNATTPVDVREANVAYTIGNGNAQRNATIIAGQFATPFGYVLPESAADFLSPERPLAFNDATNGMFQNQDYDRGAALTLPFFGALKLTAAVINGTGRGVSAGTSNSTITGPVASSITDKRNYDGVYRVAYQPTPSGGIQTFSLGASYYNGELPRGLATNPTLANGNPEPAFTGSNYQSVKKRLGGADLSLKTKSGIFVQGEYVAGRFDERTYVSAETSSNVGTTLINDAYAPGNKVKGYYGQFGYSFLNGTPHAITPGVSYDVFDRSDSGISGDQTDSEGRPILGGASGSTFTDKNLGYGLTFGIDRQTQIKFWYDEPTAVSHAANLPDPQKIGLFTAQIQVRF